MAIECFEIKWTKLFPINEIANQSEVNESGIYARYIVTKSAKKLHYIGKSTDFRQRASYHKQATAHMGFDLAKHHISLGVVYSFERSRMSLGCTAEQLNDIESYLRNTIRPKGNDPSTLKGYKGNPIIIINTGTISKPFRKTMSHNPELLKALGKSPTLSKKKKAYPPWY